MALSPSWLALSVMAGSLRHGRACPGHPPPVGWTAAEAVQPPVRGWPVCTAGHDDLQQTLLPQPLVLMPMTTLGHNDTAPPVRQRLRRLVYPDSARIWGCSLYKTVEG